MPFRHRRADHQPGIINVDFADVRTVMSEMGMAMMGTGGATGENRAREAAEKAIRSPLLEDIDLHGARGILVNITAGPDLSIGEFNDVGATVQEFASQDATIVVGTSIDMEMSDELRVTVVAAGWMASSVRLRRRIARQRVAAMRLPCGNRRLPVARIRTVPPLRPSRSRRNLRARSRSRIRASPRSWMTIWTFRPSCGARPIDAIYCSHRQCR